MRSYSMLRWALLGCTNNAALVRSAIALVRAGQSGTVRMGGDAYAVAYDHPSASVRVLYEGDVVEHWEL